MAQTTNGLILKNANGVTQETYQPNPSIDSSLAFKQANVDNADQNIKTFYVVYSAETYGTAGSGTGSASLVPSNPVSGSSNSIQTSYIIQSAQGFDLGNPGVVMFQHYNFRGYGVEFRTNNPNITESFPTGEIDGASSFVCTGGEWRLYTKTNYNGGSVLVKKGDFGNLDKFGLNDKIKSVKFIKL